MTIALFYDTETTKLPLWDQPSEDPRQPHLVQLGASLVDIEERKIRATIDLIIRPEEGWIFDDQAVAAHGIDRATAQRFGVDEVVALQAFFDLWGRADFRVGHNEQFDARIMRIGIKRYSDEYVLPNADAWKEAPAVCTATMSTQLAAIPPTEAMRRAGRNHFKRPSLAEAFQALMGRELEGAHSALADADACMSIYFAVIDRQAAVA